MSELRIAVLASGEGTNLQAIIDRFDGDNAVAVSAVASDRSDARALERARQAGIPTGVFTRSDYPGREDCDGAMARWLVERRIELVVLAGYMQLLSRAFLDSFPDRVINVHPALLPSFPGLDAIGQAIEHGVKVTGVTIHFVDAGMDTGPIILQRSIPLTYTADPVEVAQTVHRVEYELLPHAVSLFAAGSVHIDHANPRLVRVDEPAAD